MGKIEEHAIGERFERWGSVFEVQECESCKGCALLIEEENECLDARRGDFENCSAYDRDDEKDVIFVHIGEAKDD